ncbi:MAG: hypothetical protein AAGF97_09790 [Planctomycetota bacterium]
MSHSSLRIATLGVCLLLAGATWLSPLKADPPPQDKMEQIRRVIAQMRDAAQQLVDLRQQAFEEGRINLKEVLEARQQLLEVELRGATTLAERTQVLKQSLQLATQAENMAEVALNSGTGSQTELLELRLARFKIELLLLEE